MSCQSALKTQNINTLTPSFLSGCRKQTTHKRRTQTQTHGRAGNTNTSALLSALAAQNAMLDYSTRRHFASQCALCAAIIATDSERHTVIAAATTKAAGNATTTAAGRRTKD